MSCGHKSQIHFEHISQLKIFNLNTQLKITIQKLVWFLLFLVKLRINDWSLHKAVSNGKDILAALSRISSRFSMDKLMWSSFTPTFSYNVLSSSSSFSSDSSLFSFPGFDPDTSRGPVLELDVVWLLSTVDAECRTCSAIEYWIESKFICTLFSPSFARTRRRQAVACTWTGTHKHNWHSRQGGRWDCDSTPTMTRVTTMRTSPSRWARRPARWGRCLATWASPLTSVHSSRRLCTRCSSGWNSSSSSS